MSMSVLQNAKRSDVVATPFPHVVIENALPDELYQKLSASYPAMQVLSKGAALKNNAAYYLNSLDSEQSSDVAELWRDFISYHRSPGFLREVADLLELHIDHHYPWIPSEVGHPVRDFTVGRRHPGRQKNPDNRTSDIVLDCQVGMNSPVIEQSSVIAPHVDSEFKLFAGLFYLRDVNDTSTGGDLRLLETTTPSYPYRGNDYDFPKDSVKPFKMAYYRPNTFVAWLNTPLSLHDVSPRSATSYPRRAVNFLGESYSMSRGGYFSPPRRDPARPSILTRAIQRIVGTTQ